MHEYKRWGELDFVILSPQALLVLEVKGGAVACNDGIWTYTDRFGVEHRNSEGPFKQAQTGLMGMKKRLEQRIPSDDLRALPLGYGVILPQTTLNLVSIEWPEEAVTDRRRTKTPHDFARWLRNLTAYWRHKAKVTADASPKLVAEVKALLRPEFERAPGLAFRVDDAVEQLDQFTEDQYWQLDMVEANDRILVQGGAGTGKTFLAVEIAKRRAAEGMRVLLTCWSATLAAYLQARLPAAVTVLSFPELEDRTETWDYLIVDEAQDVMNSRDLNVLHRCLSRGLDHGRWCLFFDQNYQSGIRDRFEPDALDLLLTFGASSGHLRRNVRNTRQVVEQTRLLTLADLGTATTGEGPAVEFAYYSDTDGLVALLARMLARSRAEEIDPSMITVLSPLPFSQSAASLLSTKLREQITVVTPENASVFPPASFSFSTIADFKGMENRYILLIDLNTFDRSHATTSAIYVAMSRARAFLWIAAHDSIEPLWKDVAARNVTALYAAEAKA